MKKNRIQKITAQVKRNTKNAMKAKKRIKSRITHTPIYVSEQESKDKKFQKLMNCKPNPVHILSWEPGPSKFIKYDKDGKVIGFIKWAHKKRQSEYTTEAGKAAMEENKRIKNNKKELIKSILQKAGYDPTIKYTRKEKKRFTRIVKNNLFVKPTVAKKEEPLKKYEYIIQRHVDAKPDAQDIDKMKVYDYAKYSIDAHNKEEAFKKIVKELKPWQNEHSFGGVDIIDPDTNGKTYYGSGYIRELWQAA